MRQDAETVDAKSGGEVVAATPAMEHFGREEQDPVGGDAAMTYQEAA